MAPALIDGAREVEWVACRIGRGEAKPGRQAPWVPFDPTDLELAEVEAFLTKFTVELPSGKVVVDYDALAGAREGEAF
jgi:hypothetical protein